MAELSLGFLFALLVGIVDAVSVVPAATSLFAVSILCFSFRNVLSSSEDQLCASGMV
jgi:hypothetical protein